MREMPRAPKLQPAVLIVGTVAGGIAVIAVAVRAGVPIHVPVAFVLLVSAINLMLVINGSHRLRHPSEPARTGHSLMPDAASMDDAAPVRRWVGAGRLRGPLGLGHASTPLVVLSVTGSSLELRMRPAFMAALFGTRPLRILAGSGEEIFPAHGSVGRTWVGVRGEDGGEGYLATTDVTEILTLLSQRGFHVSWEVRKLPRW